MTFLSFAGVIVCLVLLAFAVYLPFHERHPLEFLVGGGLSVVALTGIALILQIKPTVHNLIIFIGFGIVLAHLAGLIPERCYLDHERRHGEVHR